MGSYPGDAMPHGGGGFILHTGIWHACLLSFACFMFFAWTLLPYLGIGALSRYGHINHLSMITAG